MAPTKISFNDHNAQPPVYVSGSFTEWQPVELLATGEPGQYQHEKIFDLAPGTYQFKFRLGPGDWWVCDNETAKDRDDAGNENNVLVVEPEPVKAAPEPVVKSPVESAKPAQVPTPAAEPAIAPMVMSNVDGPKPEVIAPVHQPIHSLVTQAAPAPEPVKPVSVAATTKPEPTPVPEAKKVEQAPETKKAIEQPVEKPVNGKAIAPAAPKDTESKGTSVSSLTPKNKKSSKAESEEPKLGWFARIFLCKSSGK